MEVRIFPPPQCNIADNFKYNKEMTFEEIKGKQGQDTVTGFEGKITARAEYIDEYVTIKLQKLSTTGEVLENWFSEKTIKVLD